jgi:hypothetical protein
VSNIHKFRLIAFTVCCTAVAVAGCASRSGGSHASASAAEIDEMNDQIAEARARDAVLWAMPASAIYRLRVGFLEVPGMADNVILTTVTPIATKQEFITPNQTTPYIGAVSDLRNGPVALEVPAKTDKIVLYGQIVDAWQATVAGVGPVGEDKGAGGKYLLLPPGYKDSIPAGYFPIRCSTYRITLAFRTIQLQAATLNDADAYTRQIKMYPLAEAANPKPTRFVDLRPYTCHTLPHYDIRGLQDIHDIISVEPVQPRDKVMMGMLATIGIEPGKSFNPPEKLKPALAKGVADAYAYMQQKDTKLFASNLYWPDRHWSFVMVPDENHGFEFVTNDAVEIDKRAAAWFFYTFYPKELNEHAGTVYLAPIADTEGQPVQAGKTYKVNIPKDTPAREFWSLTVYDRANWAFIDNPLDRASLDSFHKDAMKMNADGSVDIYFGPKAPDGLESNWIPTMGKEPYVWLRLYGPEEAFWNKSFKMPDVELVK